MENSNARNTKVKEKDDSVIYQIQGPKSFLKVKMDWANIDKVHLSFVSHTELPRKWLLPDCPR